MGQGGCGRPVRRGSGEVICPLRSTRHEGKRAKANLRRVRSLGDQSAAKGPERCILCCADRAEF